MRPVVPSYNAGHYAVCPTCAGIGKGFTATPGGGIRPSACPRCGGSGTINTETDDPYLAPKELPESMRKATLRFVR